MKKITDTSLFGRTGLTIPPIVYGTSFLGNLYKELPWESKLTIIKEWFAAMKGIVVIDTAGKYGAGLALEVIGKGLKELGISPDRILISNKLGWYRVPLTTDEPTFEPGAWVNLKYDAVQKISYDGILECWEQGCDLLGDTYKPALVSVHDPDEYLAASINSEDRSKRINDIMDAYRALTELRDRGEVKAVGIGAKNWHIIYELHKHVQFDWVMFANSLTLYTHPRDILDFMQQLSLEGIGIINSAVFNAGFLTGGDYFDYRKIDPASEEDRKRLVWRDKFFQICRDFNIQPGDACLQFALAPPEVNAVALNPSKPERIRRNIKVIKTPLPEAFWDALKENHIINPDYPYL
ncbi:MAG: aldo/keto reductase [Bacteroidales bacterium]|nr:aldo/keto reductase [Bacteroidales bacterium]